MNFVEAKIRRILQDLFKLMYPYKEPIYSCEFTDLDSGIRPSELWDKLAVFEWKPFRKDDRWGGKNRHFRFRLKAIIPEHFSQKTVLLDVKTGREGGWTAFNPQFLVYVNGSLVQGMDVNHNEILLAEKAVPGTEYDIILHAYSGTMDGLMELYLNLVVLDTDMERLYYNIKVAFDSVQLLSSEQEKKYDILAILTKAIDMLDLRKPQSSCYHESIKLANEFLEKELYRKDWGQSSIITHCIGHTHIDVAWMWTFAQTREKAQRSFSTVINLMKMYPEYAFMSSQPVLYQYVKEDNPQLYEQIKERIKEGRWEAEGGMWLEADCNIPSGESLVRQIMFGIRFFMEEFGVRNEILWLPDTFGYTAALPQIMKKAGLKYFMSSKLSWNEFNTFPYDSFEWEGIDGSSVLAYFITTPDDNGLEFAPDFSTYNGTLKPKNILGAWERFKQKQYNKDILFCFGYGDGGGGPTKEMLEYARRMKKGLPGIPHVIISRVKDFFIALQENAAKSKSFPKWVGELYFEYHRGTYTSIAKNKKFNRLCELMYQDVEWVCSMNTILCNKVYPQADINNAWKTILINQFHDLLSGSSIKPVYEESHRQYASLLSGGERLINQALDSMSSNIAVQETSLVVFNQLSFTRNDIVVFELPDKLINKHATESIEIYDNKGQLITTQIFEGTSKKGIAFYAECVPAKGYKTYTIKKVASECYQRAMCDNEVSELIVSNEELSNKFFTIKLDQNGNIISIFDKRANREVLKSGMRANVLQAFEDKPMICDAWNIDYYYSDKMWEIDNIEGIEVVEAGQVFASLRLKRKFMDSMIVQDICIYKDIPRIDFISNIDWKESQILLKACFPVNIHANQATYDIQFGNITRPTHRNTSWEQAQFEVYAHKWVDLSEDGYGISILNDCKYGYDIKGDVMRITLIKSPIDPYPEADKEMHTFTYSLYPHVGDWRQALTPNMAYALNCPMYSKIIAPNEAGNLPPEISFVKTDVENVFIETVKKAEDSECIIIRVYECYNRRVLGKISFCRDLIYVRECSLLEEDMSEIEFSKDSFSFDIKPYEIKTFKVKFV